MRNHASVLLFLFSCFLNTLTTAAQPPNTNSNINANGNIALASTATPLPPTVTQPQTNAEGAMPSQWALDTAAIMNAVWWYILLIAVLLILWFNKETLKALLKRISTQSQSLNLPGGFGLTMPAGETETAIQLQETSILAVSPVESNDPETVKETEVEVAQSEPTHEPNSEADGNTMLFLELHDTAVEKRDLHALEPLFQKYQENESDKDKRAKNEVYYQYLRYRAGDLQALSALEKQSKEVEKAYSALVWLSYIHRQFTGNIDKALKALETLLPLAPDTEARAMHIVSIANLLYQIDKSRAYKRLTEATKNGEFSRKAKSNLYLGLAGLYKQDEDDYMRVLTLEKAYEYAEDGSPHLFDLAYAYGETSYKELCWDTYQKKLALDPTDSMAMNNLGVAYGELGMPFSSVRLQKESLELGNSLAAANLASKFLFAGFEKETEETLELGRKDGNPHQNISHYESELANQRDKENTQQEKVNSLAQRQRPFLRDYAKAYFERTNSYKFEGKWRIGWEDGYVADQQGEVRKEPTGEYIAEWNYDINRFAFQEIGCAIELTKMEHVKKSFSSDEYEWRMTSTKGIGYLSEDGLKIHVMMSAVDEKQFWTMERMPTNSTEIKVDTVKVEKDS